MSIEQTRALLLGGPMDGTRLVLRGRFDRYSIVYRAHLPKVSSFSQATLIQTPPPFCSSPTRVYLDARVPLTALVASGIDRVYVDEAEDRSPENIIRLLILGYAGGPDNAQRLLIKGYAGSGADATQPTNLDRR